MKFLSLILVGLIFDSDSFVFAQSKIQHFKNVYVVDFTTRDREKNGHTSKFAYDFEAALVQYGHFSVLERHIYDRVLSELDRERALANIIQLTKPSLDSLKAKHVDLLIFGEVFDDIESGQINITVSFQSFDRAKVLVESILYPRGLLNDARSRKEAMRNLVKKIYSNDKDEFVSTKLIYVKGFNNLTNHSISTQHHSVLQSTLKNTLVAVKTLKVTENRNHADVLLRPKITSIDITERDTREYLNEKIIQVKCVLELILTDVKTSQSTLSAVIEEDHKYLLSRIDEIDLPFDIAMKTLRKFRVDELLNRMDSK